jgi:hypothetical protein
VNSVAKAAMARREANNHPFVVEKYAGLLAKNITFVSCVAGTVHDILNSTTALLELGNSVVRNDGNLVVRAFKNSR